MRFAKAGFAAVVVLIGVCLGNASAADAPKYDMAPYRALADDALKLVAAKDYDGAHKKTIELETKWDDGTKALKAANRAVWGPADKQMDVAIEACKDAKDAAGAEKAVKALNDFKTKLDAAEKLK